MRAVSRPRKGLQAEVLGYLVRRYAKSLAFLDRSRWSIWTGIRTHAHAQLDREAPRFPHHQRPQRPDPYRENLAPDGQELAEAEYEKYNRQRIQQSDAVGGEFEKAINQLLPMPKPKKKGGRK